MDKIEVAKFRYQFLAGYIGGVLSCIEDIPKERVVAALKEIQEMVRDLPINPEEKLIAAITGRTNG